MVLVGKVLIVLPLVLRASEGTLLVLLLRDKGCGNGRGGTTAAVIWESVLRGGAAKACAAVLRKRAVTWELANASEGDMSEYLRAKV